MYWEEQSNSPASWPNLSPFRYAAEIFSLILGIQVWLDTRDKEFLLIMDFKHAENAWITNSQCTTSEKFFFCRQCWDMCKNCFLLFFQSGPPKHKEIVLTPRPTRHSILWSETPLAPSPNPPIRPSLHVLAMLWLCLRTICVFAHHLGDKGIQTEGNARMVDRWLGQKSSDMRAAWKTKAISTFHTAWGFSQRRKKYCRLLMDMVSGSTQTKERGIHCPAYLCHHSNCGRNQKGFNLKHKGYFGMFLQSFRSCSYCQR